MGNKIVLYKIDVMREVCRGDFTLVSSGSLTYSVKGGSIQSMMELKHKNGRIVLEEIWDKTDKTLCKLIG